MKKHCSVEGCEGSVKGRGYCPKHYARLRAHGSPTMTLQAERGSLLSFVEAVVAGGAPTEMNGCVLWPFRLNHKGYPWMRHPETGNKVPAGTIVLERTVGPRPSDKHTMGHAPHSVCGHRSCIAPAHLSWQTYAEQAIQRERVDGTGFKLAGFANPQATVPDDRVAEAIARCTAGEGQTAIAADYGVGQSTVSRWVRGASRTSAR